MPLQRRVGVKLRQEVWVVHTGSSGGFTRAYKRFPTTEQLFHFMNETRLEGKKFTLEAAESLRAFGQCVEHGFVWSLSKAKVY